MYNVCTLAHYATNVNAWMYACKAVRPAPVDPKGRNNKGATTNDQEKGGQNGADLAEGILSLKYLVGTSSKSMTYEKAA